MDSDYSHIADDESRGRVSLNNFPDTSHGVSGRAEPTRSKPETTLFPKMIYYNVELPRKEEESGRLRQKKPCE